MASSANTVSTLNGFFKEVYSDELRNLIPDGVKFYNMIPFNKESKMLGNLYHQPVVLGLEHGVTYGGTAGGVFNLNAPVAGVVRDAQVQGYEMMLRSAISTGAISRSTKDSSSFERGTKHLVANMLRSFSRRLEVQLLYGQRGLGAVSGRTGEVLTLTNASWAPGIWSGAEGMLIDVYNGTSLRAASLEISSVSFTNRTITTSSGSAAASVAAGDVIYYKGAYGNEFDGIDEIIRNTGTLFNISASSYNLWQGNVMGNGGSTRDISFDLLGKAVTRLMEKGLSDKDLKCFVNPIQFQVLLDEQDQKHMFDTSYSSDKAKAGSKKLEFHSQNGMIEVISSIYVKAGSAYILCMDEFSRVGSSDITFEMPGFEGEFFRILSDSSGYELRAYTDQALFCTAPGLQCVLDDLSVPAAG